ncbi:hypothetical protein HZS_300 [Henneguya salminicola]|nr:hypothetical protein HZS_300 [Henneguya salminicola]
MFAKISGPFVLFCLILCLVFSDNQTPQTCSCPSADTKGPTGATGNSGARGAVAPSLLIDNFEYDAIEEIIFDYKSYQPGCVIGTQLLTAIATELEKDELFSERLTLSDLNIYLNKKFKRTVNAALQENLEWSVLKTLIDSEKCVAKPAETLHKDEVRKLVRTDLKNNHPMLLRRNVVTAACDLNTRLDEIITSLAAFQAGIILNIILDFKFDAQKLEKFVSENFKIDHKTRTHPEITKESIEIIMNQLFTEPQTDANILRNRKFYIECNVENILKIKISDIPKPTVMTAGDQCGLGIGFSIAIIIFYYGMRLNLRNMMDE